MLFRSDELSISEIEEVGFIEVSQYKSKTTKISIKEHVLSIGKSAFAQWQNLHSVNFGVDLTMIGDYAFYGCTNLKTINYADEPSLYVIGSFAFSECNGIEKFNLTNSLIEIGDRAFFKCMNLKAFNNEYECPTFDVDDYGILYKGKINIADRSLICCPPKFENPYPEYAIDVTCCKIENYAFAYCEYDNEIHFQDTSQGGPKLNVIDEGAFYEAKKLIINLEDCSKIEKIGEKAFYNCLGITELHFESCDDLISIESETFYKCVNLNTIKLPQDVAKIGERAFYGCENLDIDFMDLIESKSFLVENVLIGDQAFYGCKKLHGNVNIQGNTLIGEKAFYETNINGIFGTPDNYLIGGKGDLYNKGKTKVLFYPNVKNGYSIETLSISSEETNQFEIPSEVFLNNKIIENVIIKSDLIKIDDNAFSGCVNLKCFAYKGLKVPTVGVNAFSGTQIQQVSVSKKYPNLYFGDFKVVKGYANEQCLGKINFKDDFEPRTVSIINVWIGNFPNVVEDESNVVIKSFKYFDFLTELSNNTKSINLYINDNPGTEDQIRFPKFEKDISLNLYGYSSELYTLRFDYTNLIENNYTSITANHVNFILDNLNKGKKLQADSLKITNGTTTNINSQNIDFSLIKYISVQSFDAMKDLYKYHNNFKEVEFTIDNEFSQITIDNSNLSVDDESFIIGNANVYIKTNRDFTINVETSRKVTVENTDDDKTITLSKLSENAVLNIISNKNATIQLPDDFTKIPFTISGSANIKIKGGNLPETLSLNGAGLLSNLTLIFENSVKKLIVTNLILGTDQPVSLKVLQGSESSEVEIIDILNYIIQSGIKGEISVPPLPNGNIDVENTGSLVVNTDISNKITIKIAYYRDNKVDPMIYIKNGSLTDISSISLNLENNDNSIINYFKVIQAKKELLTKTQCDKLLVKIWDYGLNYDFSCQTDDEYAYIQAIPRTAEKGANSEINFINSTSIIVIIILAILIFFVIIALIAFVAILACRNNKTKKPKTRAGNEDDAIFKFE